MDAAEWKGMQGKNDPSLKKKEEREQPLLYIGTEKWSWCQREGG